MAGILPRAPLAREQLFIKANVADVASITAIESDVESDAQGAIVNYAPAQYDRHQDLIQDYDHNIAQREEDHLQDLCVKLQQQTTQYTTEDSSTSNERLYDDNGEYQLWELAACGAEFKCRKERKQKRSRRQRHKLVEEKRAVQEVAAISILTDDAYVEPQAVFVLSKQRPMDDGTEEFNTVKADKCLVSETLQSEEEEEIKDFDPPEMEQYYAEDDVNDDDLLLLIFEVEDDANLAETAMQEDKLDTLLELDCPQMKLLKSERIDIKTILRAEQLRNTKEIEDFISELIDRATDVCYAHDLDKVKLLKDLRSMLRERCVEEDTRTWLNRKMVEHYRQRRVFTPIMPDNREALLEHSQKYRQSMEKLDQLLGLECETKRTVKLQIETLERDLFELNAKSQWELENFEQLVRKTINGAKCGELITKRVTNYLKEMARAREEISQIRYILIQRQHTFAMLMEKKGTVKRFDSKELLNDIQKMDGEILDLSDTVKEHGTELQKWRSCCYLDLHLMSHIRERQQTLEHNMRIKSSMLRELIKERKRYIEYAQQIRAKNVQLRQNIKQLQQQQKVLVLKPMLRADFQQIVKKLGGLRSRVDSLRRQHINAQGQLKKHSLMIK